MYVGMYLLMPQSTYKILQVAYLNVISQKYWLISGITLHFIFYARFFITKYTEWQYFFHNVMEISLKK